MIYHRSIRVEFNHCDPAGIVFYPRYFEMTNSVIENFFRDVAQLTFGQMMTQGHGAPTAAVQTEYHAPSRLDDLLDWRLTVTRLGRTSLGFAIVAHGDGVHRLSTELTLVYINTNGRPQPWPEEVRARLAAFKETP